MYTSKNDFRIGAFEISPVLNRIKHGSVILKIEPLIMDVLAHMALRSGEIVLRDDFISKVWKSTESSDESLTRAISNLRKVFREFDPNLEYIETVPKRGYRLLQPAEFIMSATSAVSYGSPENLPNRTQAQELYLQGRSLNERPFHTNVLQVSAELLEQAVALEEGFADAHSELGNCYSLMSTYQQSGDKPGFIRKAAACAERAIQLDPNAAFARTLIALEQFTYSNIVGAIEITEEAYNLDPENSEIALRLGYFYAAIGLTKQAIPYIEKSIRLDPIQGRNFQILATVKLCNGDLEEADHLAKTAIDMQHHFACETYAAVAFAMGNYKEAGERLLAGRTYLSEFLGDKFVDDAVWAKIISEAYSPDRSVRESLGHWIKGFLFKPGSLPSIPLAQAIVRTGPANAFFEIMGNHPPPGTHGTLLCIWGSTDNCLAIRESSEFPEFAERMGLVKAWEKYGNPDYIN